MSILFILLIFTLNSSHFSVIFGLFNYRYRHVSGTLGSILVTRFSTSFSKTIELNLNLFLGPLPSWKLYVLTIFSEHKFSSNFVAFLIKSGCSLNFYRSKFNLHFLSLHLEHIHLYPSIVWILDIVVSTNLQSHF